ncbi:chymotrypsin-like protease CTRL-1 [Drosophila takahashii]|uniref:chymotrypsin-like protease CTRL-1 n=1 Tax=Drosophila takahashii TaxID=29030 RepID=UPI003898E219
MKSFVVFLALFGSVFSHVKISHLLDKSCISPRKQQERIVFGQNALVESSPWMAILRSSTVDFLCAGTLIHKNFVLTAAHCIIGKGQLIVRLGVYDRSCTVCKEVKEYNVVESIPHPRFSVYQESNDIGLLRLDKDVKYNSYIRPMCLILDPRFNPRIIDRFQVFGWGITQNSTLSQVVQTTHMNRRTPPTSDCSFANTNSKICAGSELAYTCMGDSGGPLISEVQYKNYLIFAQIGIVSNGPESCMTDAVYTDVNYFKWWIQSHVSR